MSPLILIGIFCLASTSATTFDVSKDVDDIIAHCNELVRNSGFRNMSLPDIVNGNWFTKRHFTSGSIQDLASINRIGRANMTTKSLGSMTEFTVTTTVGLESLESTYHYYMQFLRVLETSGHIRVKVKTNTVLAKMVIITDTKDSTCALLSKGVDVILLDDVEVTIQEHGFTADIVARYVKYLLRFSLPNIIQVVNKGLDEFTDNYPLSQELNQYVCNYFMKIFSNIVKRIR